MSTTTQSAPLPRLLVDGWGPVLLVWSCLVLLPVGRLVEVPVFAMAACGLWLSVRQGRALLRRPGVRLMLAVFLAAWLPMLLSLPDAVDAANSARVTLNHLRFLFAGVYVAFTLSSLRDQDRLITLSGALLGFWVLDAYVQMGFGVDLLGRRPWPGGISAVFGEGSSKFGTTFAVIAPLLWVYAARAGSAPLLAVVMLASAFAVMSAGSRAAWVSLLVVFCVYAWGRREWIRGLGARVLVPLLVLALVLPALAYQVSEPFKRRFDQSLSELTGRTPVSISPLGHRAWIWKGAVNMIADNPVNGVGARGFRAAFTRYAEPDDPFVAMDPPFLPTHSHHVLLEIGAETGLVGLLGLLLAAAMMLRAGLGASQQARARLLPYAAALTAAFFPLNTHLAIYSAHWSQQVWWLIAVFCACVGAGGSPRGSAPGEHRVPAG
jgi:O-antigen ligase